jgi:hypothetical protein
MHHIQTLEALSAKLVDKRSDFISYETIVLTRYAGIRFLAVFRYAFLMVVGRLDGLSFGEVFRYCCSP